MDAATEKPRPAGFVVFLAGLQAGMLGVCWMLAWLGVSAVWARRSFWTAENLMASVFYGGAAIHSGFASITVSGIAVYLLLYSLLGGMFALMVYQRLPRVRVLLVSLVFALGWYYLTFHLIWRNVLPLVSLLHAERPTLLGHLIYGTFLGRFPVYLEKKPEPAPSPEAAPAEVGHETTGGVSEPAD